MYQLRGRDGALAAAALAVVVVASLGVVSARAVAASSGTVAVSIVHASLGGECPQPSTPAATACFNPNLVTTLSGGAVMWTNTTNTAHTLTRCSDATCPATGRGNGGDSPFGASGQHVAKGASYSFTFTGPGTYYYDCTDGRCAIGEVIVTAPTPSPTPVVLSPGAGSAPLATPTPSPTPIPTPSPTAPPSDTSSAVAVTTPSPDASPTAFAPAQIGAVGGNGGGGPPLVIIVLVILALTAVGGAVLSFRLYRG